MPAAGETIIAGRIPGERIATDIDTADSSTFTSTETTVMSVTAPLVTGRTYRVRFIGRFNSTNTAETAAMRIREDSSSGTEMQSAFVDHDARSATIGGEPVVLEAEYTAVSTGDKTFVVTGTAGPGNWWMEAAGNRPAFLYVDYIRG